MERRLVEQARRGDQAAFAQLARGISPRLFSVAQRILRDHHRAEDATQQALILIWRRLPRLADADRFDAWSYRVLVNACYAELRRGRREPDATALLEADQATDDDSVSIGEREALERAFARLPGEQRAVLVLQYYLDLAHPEIAQLLGVPIGTVKSRASSGRQALRAALEADARGVELRRWPA